jgi:GntR family transcriptional regulator/MocR family aminotransferase
VDRFVAVRQAMDICPSHLYQAVVNDLIGEGYLARHIRRMRTLYGTRRAALIEALEEQFDGRVKVVGGDAGLHLVAELPSRLQDVEISERAARRKLWLWPLSSCFLSPKRRQGLILGFGGTATKDIPNEVQRLRETVHF